MTASPVADTRAEHDSRRTQQRQRCETSSRVRQWTALSTSGELEQSEAVNGNALRALPVSCEGAPCKSLYALLS